MSILEIKLQGKSYEVSCPPDQQEALLAAAAYLNERLDEVGQRTQASGEKLAIMTALNLAHEFLHQQSAGGLDLVGVKRRMNLVSARLSGVLAQQDKLF